MEVVKINWFYVNFTINHALLFLPLVLFSFILYVFFGCLKFSFRKHLMKLYDQRSVKSDICSRKMGRHILKNNMCILIKKQLCVHSCCFFINIQMLFFTYRWNRLFPSNNGFSRYCIFTGVYCNHTMCTSRNF